MRLLLALAPSLIALGACADPVPVFDIAYPTKWTFSVSGPATGWAVVVNTSQAPLDLASLQINSVTDDHDVAELRATATPSAVELAPGMAGGSLSGLSQELLVGGGVVSEQFADTTASYLSLELIGAPEGEYDIAATVNLSLADRDVSLPMTLHVVPGPTIYLDPAAPRRIQAVR